MDTQQRPPVVTWFFVYNGIMVFFALLTVGLGIFFGNFPEEWKSGLNEEDKMVFEIYKYAMPIIGIPMTILHALPFFLRPRPWVWIFNLVLICLGMTSCMIVASVPLLIFWLKPELKAYYGRSGQGASLPNSQP